MSASDTERILRVGLTGGIASGKTTVARRLAEHGALVVDADRIAHRLLEAGQPAYDPVVQRFGEGILDEHGSIVRSRLAAIVFADERSRHALDAVVHPLVRAEFTRTLAGYAPEGHSPVAVFDAALLVETGAWRDFHRLIVVRCSRESQLRRLLARDGLGAESAERRIAAQAPLERKVALADYVIDTEGTLRATHEQTDAVWTELLADFENRFGPPQT